MSWMDIIADRKIRDAQEEGKFDNLPGKGKPLNLEIDPRVPPELRAAYRLMKEAEILPDWIQLDKEIRQRQERWEARVAAFTRSREEDLAAGGPAKQVEARLDGFRDRFLEAAAQELRAQNGMIDRLNLIVPAASRQRLRINLRERVAELEARFPRFRPASRSQTPPWWQVVEQEEARRATELGNRMPLRRKRGSIG